MVELKPCPPRYIIRDVIGPDLIPGRILKKPGHGIKIENLQQSRYKINEEDRSLIKENKNRKQSEIYQTFWTKADIQSLYNRIREFVQHGLRSAENDLNAKRNRLKIILLEEEAGLTREYVDKAQQSANRIFEQKKKLAAEIEGRHKREGEHYAQEAYEKIFKGSSDEYKSMLVTENKKYCSIINQFQIRDRELAQMKEKEEEQFWAKTMDKLDMAKAEGISGQNKDFKQNYGHADDILQKQIKAIRKTKQVAAQIKADEEDFWRKMNEMFAEDARLFDQRNKNINEQRRQDLIDQIEENRRRRKERADREGLLDRLFSEQNQRDLDEQEAKKVDNRAKERRELDIFRDSVEQVRKSYREEEEELERLISEEVKKIEKIRKCNRNKLAKARKNLQNDVIETQKRQIQEHLEQKEAQKLKDKKYDEYSNIRYEQNVQLDNNQDDQKQRDVQSYMKNLLEQEDFEDELKRREAYEILEWLTDRKQQAKIHEERARKLLNLPLSGSAIHPFLYPFIGNC